ncbi:hypothetical protein ACOMHN_012150 [Nucella lapillus]
MWSTNQSWSDGGHVPALTVRSCHAPPPRVVITNTEINLGTGSVWAALHAAMISNQLRAAPYNQSLAASQKEAASCAARECGSVVLAPVFVCTSRLRVAVTGGRTGCNVREGEQTTCKQTLWMDFPPDCFTETPPDKTSGASSSWY